MRLDIKNLSCGYTRNPVIEDICLSVEPGETLCLLGSNGSGKTTFLKTVLGLLKSRHGQVLLDGHDISAWSHSHIARVMGYVPQSHQAAFPYRVVDMVLMGRTAHLKAFASPSSHDMDIALEALDSLHISHLQDRAYTEISGGERQLVLLARALAQEPQILIMDEPTANLDFGHQIMVLEQVRDLAINRNLAVLMSSHFPAHAFLYASKVLLFSEGRMLDIGRPDETITEGNLRELYGVDIEIVTVQTRQSKEVKVCLPVAN